ncbi:type-F conjugative transfer system protein TrbI [Sphingomonas sp. SUN039]|uniref:type-F conjugative transfer system protein TrbI n=1 Tax=Sphingomonas sp. SUN039 TaxID=2937787 RepID=UPI0021649AB5|nr:type-F conjugative transfer system protein TrbI [Sphingomonas sp. SUN039]UVO53795.1 type-F conjugative transfer system protein TrbI [Sphingomonas sp. SUN039]
MSAPSRAAMPPQRRFAGFSYGQLALGTLLVFAAIWGMWATSRIFALDDRRVVSVRLASIVNDFVTVEAKSGTPPEQLAPRTRAFMTALDTVLKKRAASGEVVLVGEAVVASSVPDVTADVVADLGRFVKMPTAGEVLPVMPAPISPRAAPAPRESAFDSAVAPDATVRPSADTGAQQ